MSCTLCAKHALPIAAVVMFVGGASFVVTGFWPSIRSEPMLWQPCSVISTSAQVVQCHSSSTWCLVGNITLRLEVDNQQTDLNQSRSFLFQDVLSVPVAAENQTVVIQWNVTYAAQSQWFCGFCATTVPTTQQRVLAMHSKAVNPRVTAGFGSTVLSTVLCIIGGVLLVASTFAFVMCGIRRSRRRTWVTRYPVPRSKTEKLPLGDEDELP